MNLVAAGALKELKNFEYLLQVFENLTNEEIYLDIYGEGNKDPYEAIIKNKNLKVRMMSRADDMATVIQNYDLFIMPSKFEGFPLSVFEAMAAGVPLMLSDIAPLKSIVKEHAIYFQLNDAEKTAKQILTVQQNKIDISSMAVKAKLYAGKTVTRDIYIKNLLKIYDHLL